MKLKAIVRHVVDENGQPARLRHDGADTIWIPLGQMNRDGQSFGIDHECRWVAESASDLICLQVCDFFAPLLPLLDEDFGAFRTSLQYSLQSHFLPTEIELSFPYIEVIKCGLGRNSFWVDKALAWLDDVPPDDECLRLLKAVVDDKNHTGQKVRQKVKKLLNDYGHGR